MTYTLALADADHTRAVGAVFGTALLNLQHDQPFIIHLVGDLGAGKTTLVSGLLQAMGYVGVVRSPTYTLIEPYEFRRKDLSELHVMHMDLYRLTDPSQLEELGVRDMLIANTVLLIEWPDRAGNQLPVPDMLIQLAYPDSGAVGRTLKIVDKTSVAQRLLQQTTSHTLRA